jgi:acyl-CoA hydrolase
MTFLKPIYLGNLVTLTAELTYTGRTSMEVRVEVVAEDVLKGKRTPTNVAYVVYVALDDAGRPCGVPRLVPENDAERQRMARAQARQQVRLKQRRLEGESP